MKLSKIPKHIWWFVVLPLVLVGVGGWRLWPVLVVYRWYEERIIRVRFTLIAVAERDYKAKDLDKNGINDFWTADLSGLYEKGLRDIDVAHADAAPLHPLVATPVPIVGYLFVAMKRTNQSDAFGAKFPVKTDVTGNTDHHLNTWAFCAYPAEYDWRHKHTYIFNEKAKIYRIDNCGEPVTEWPPGKQLTERWEKFDWFK